MAEEHDPYRKWLGIPPSEQPPNLYRLLGIGLFEPDLDVISGAADRQMTHVRTFQTGKHSTLSQKILNELAAARVCLLDRQRKGEYDAQLREELAARRTAPPPPPTSAAAAPPPVGAQAPPVPAEPIVPQVTVAPKRYGAEIRRKRAAWQGPVAAVVLLAVLLGVVAWAVNSTSRSSPKPEPSESRLPAAARAKGSSGTNGRLSNRHVSSPTPRSEGAAPSDEPIEVPIVEFPEPPDDPIEIPVVEPPDGPIPIPGIHDNE